MSTSGDSLDAMIKMFEEKKSVLIKKNQELQKLSESAEISEYKRLAKDILRNHTLTIYSILSFLQMSVMGEAARQSQIATLKSTLVQLQEVKNNPEIMRYINEAFDKYNEYLEKYSYLSGYKV
jgi:formate dehydrogenase maturation protein FdhE